MLIKLKPMRRAHYAILLTAATLLVGISVDAVAMESKMMTTNSATWDRALGSDLNDFRIKRNLRTNAWMKMGDDDASSENRGFDLSGTKLKGVTKGGMNNLQKLAKLAKLKLTSSNQQATDKLFSHLKVGQVESNLDLFQSAQFKQWVQAVTKAYKKTSDRAEVALLATLTGHYGDDIIARLIVEAKRMTSTNALAENLEKVQLAAWQSSGKTADDIFKVLKLSDEAAELLKNPALKMWISYVNKLGKESPYTLLLTKLATRYDDESIVKLLLPAKNDWDTGTLARKLEAAQFENWSSNGKNADDIFKLLKLDIEADDLLKNPALLVWTTFVAKTKKEDPMELLLLKFQARYNDEDLAKMIINAQNNAEKWEFASQLQWAEIANWQSRGYTADDVFKILRLNKHGDDVLNSPTYSTWTSYLAELNKKNPDESMFLVLKAHYGDAGLAKLVAEAKEIKRTKAIATKLQEEVWRSEGKSGGDVFKLLMLEKMGDDAYKSPAFTAWVSYMIKLNKLDDKPDQFGVMRDVTERYGHGTVARLLGHAIENASLTQNKGTKYLVKDLETLLFKLWMKRGEDPGRVGTLLGGDPNGPANLKVMLNFQDFYKTNGGSPFY